MGRGLSTSMILCASVVLGACGDGGSSTGAGGGDGTGGSATGGGGGGAGCLWLVEREELDESMKSATVGNGELTLDIGPGDPEGPGEFFPLYNGASLAVSQAGLTGDFSIDFEISQASAGLEGGFIQLGVYGGEPFGQGIVTIGDLDGALGISAGWVFEGDLDSDAEVLSPNFANASASVSRTGDTLTVSITASGTTRSITKSGFTSSGLEVFAAVGRRDVTTEPVSIRIDEITVTGSVSSDSFVTDQLCTP